MLARTLASRLSTSYRFQASSSSFSLQNIGCFLPTQLRSIGTVSPTSENFSRDRKEEVVIVGGGIAGFATALALHRAGVRSLVLEQSESLRTEGASISLSKNGWQMLDVLGVGNELRKHFLDIQSITMKTLEGKELGSLNFKDQDPSQEIRAVERRILLKTLVDQLPPNTIQFSSKLASIEQESKRGESKLQLTNGSQISAKIVIGCDGIRSSVAKWMGFPEAKYTGHCCFRGLAFYPNEHQYQPKATEIYAKGMRAGFLPLSQTKVFCPKITDPTVLKGQALDLMKNWPSEMTELIDLSMEDTISLARFEDRWLWPIITPPVYKGRVVLAGDAWHPMTPNLGQGGCCALEDAVILGNTISKAMKFTHEESIEDALRSYGQERWARVFPMTIMANLAGKLRQSDNPVICSIRDRYILPKLVKSSSTLKHTNFNSELLKED